MITFIFFIVYEYRKRIHRIK